MENPIAVDKLSTNNTCRKMKMLWSLVREAKTMRQISFDTWSELSGVPVNTLKRWQQLSDDEGAGIEIGGAFRAVTSLGLTMDQFLGIDPRPDLRSGDLRNHDNGDEISAMQELLLSKEETITSMSEMIKSQEVLIASKEMAIKSKDACIADKDVIIKRQLNEKKNLFILLNQVLKIDTSIYHDESNT